MPIHVLCCKFIIIFSRRTCIVVTSIFLCIDVVVLLYVFSFRDRISLRVVSVFVLRCFLHDKKNHLLVCVRVIIVYVDFFSCYKQFDGLSLVERTKRCVVCRWPLWLILNCRLCVLSCALFVRSILALKQKNWIFAFKYPNAQAIETRILRSTLRFSFGTSNSDFSSPLMSNWRAQIKN